MSDKVNFIHLHLHTEYSIVDGLVQIDNLIEQCVVNKIPAVAITDHCNLFAMVKFFKAAMNAGIKPIFGADVFIEQTQSNKPSRLTLLCQNQQGYKNLTRLISHAYQHGQSNEQIIIKKNELVSNAEGLIALSGIEGEIGQALIMQNPELAKKSLDSWMALFPERFYLEITRTNKTNEEQYIHEVLQLITTHPVPVVATNDVRFLAKEDYVAHEARVCIYESWILEDAKRPHNYTADQYLKNSAEMSELFSDLPEALQNSVEIAKRCNLELTLNEIYLPSFPTPDNMLIADYFAHEAHEGLKKRFQSKPCPQMYLERLEMELNVINKMGFAGYFLIVADFIRWAKQQSIPVGPGRGSGAGSLVAYSLNITDLDPIEHDLLFERFLNPERVSMPDFDVDFCMEGRDRVIEYVAQKYGRESVSQIITFGTMAARAVVRDVGRVMNFPYGFVDKIAKLIPFELGMTLKKALQQDEQLFKRYQDEDDVHALIDLALKLEGITRNAGKHAGGVVIAPSLLTDFTPLYCEADGNNLVTQFDKDDVEAIGLVKFDFLGLRTLTIIDWAVKTINAKKQINNEELLDLNHLPLDDEKTYKLLKSCMTTAIFQLESRGMKDLIKRLQPDCFKDIVDLGALFRPGPLQTGMVDDFINRKHKRAKTEYPHPLLESVLNSTYGVILYQEQVMQIAQVLAGYSLGKADILRRAMGKKKPEEMAKQRESFVKGAIERKVDAQVANFIFDLMEKFAGYGFNRSHSAAYALLTYQTAWLKAHYPAEFMAAVLSSDMDNTDKVIIFIDECQNLGIKILPPDIQQSDFKFTVNEKSEIIYGLGAIKGAGAAAIENILQARNKCKKFTDLFSFCQGVDLRKVNRRVLEALIRSGAMDSFQKDRAVLLATIDIALQAAEQNARQLEVGQVDLFGNIINSESTLPKHAYATANKLSIEERLNGERETLGLYLSGHPITKYEKELSNLISSRIVDLKIAPEKSLVIVAGLVLATKVMQTKSGNRMAIATIDDRSARMEVVIFAEAFNKYRDLIVKDQILILEGELQIDEFTENYRLTARKIFNLDQARENFAKSLWIKLTDKIIDQTLIDELTKILNPYRGGTCPVFISYFKSGANANIALGDEWKIKPQESLLQQLATLFNFDEVMLGY